MNESVFCNILTEFGLPMELVGLIKMWLIETSEVWTDKHSFITFSASEKKRWFIGIYFQHSLEQAIRKVSLFGKKMSVQ
jgi:hypothetical protein